MNKVYVVFTLNGGDKVTAYPLGKYKAYTVDEMKKHIEVCLNDESYVQVDKWGISLESLKHYEVREKEPVS